VIRRVNPKPVVGVDGREHAFERCVGEPDVDEPWAGHLRRLDQPSKIRALEGVGCDFPGCPAELAG